MVRSQKPKRVTWASDLNLCQTRLFVSEDPPSQVGVGAQDNLQVKASWLLHSTGVGFDDQLPPGFEGTHSTDQLKEEISQMPLIKWQRPPRFVPNPNWQVVDGEESKEVEVQNQREMRVLEAIYPRPSAIPQSPSVSSEVENTHFEDHQVLRIPITAIEDEDATHPPPSDPPAPTIRLRTNVSANEVSTPGVEPDVHAAASAAFTAILRSNEEGSLVDQELLIKILHNPKLMEELFKDFGTSANNYPRTTPMPSPGPPGYTMPAPPPPPPTSSGVFHHAPPPPGFVNMPGPAAKPPPPVKDMNYFKSLIQQHGGEKQSESREQAHQQFVNHQYKTEQVQSSNLRECKSKNKKPCIYFNSSRGCKNGANCTFHHDMSAQQRNGSMPEVPRAKRMKLDREITGRT